MKNSKFSYYVREGVSSIFTHGFMSFASVCIIIACLIIMGSFSLLAVNVNSIISGFENENVLLAYVDDSLSENDARALQSQILSVPNVESATFMSREEAMQEFLGKYKDQSRFANIDASVFRDRYIIYMQDINLTQQTQDSLMNVQGVGQVNANLTIAKGLVTLRNIVTGVSVVLVVILLIISLFIMSNTIKLATFERREEIAIMKMVGATNSFIRWPFVFQGFILGLIGSFAAFILQWVIYNVITHRISGGTETLGFITTVPFSHTAILLFLVFAVIGFGVGVGGSAMAIRKYLKV